MKLHSYISAKLHGMTVTACHFDYHGSQTIPASVLKAAGIQPYERVLVVNQANGKRWETYALSGPEGVCTLNGAAAHNGNVGDKLIIMTFTLADHFEPATVLFFDDKNQVINRLYYERGPEHVEGT